MPSSRRVPGTLVVLALAALAATAAAGPRGWPGYAHDAQHGGGAKTAAQPLGAVRWSTPVDLAPPLSGNDLLIHYGSPLVTQRNTVLVTVKTTSAGDFRVDARAGATGALLWSLATDYVLPPVHNWVPSMGSVLARTDRLVVPAAGGTVLRRARPDLASGATDRLAFYGLAAYTADPATFASTAFVSTPITADAHGNVFFGFVAAPGAPLGLASGIARISSLGQGTWVSAAVAAGDASIAKVPLNAAPALSANGRTLYVPVTDVAGSGFGHGYLLALDSRTLATLGRVRLQDPSLAGVDARLPDDGTASPTVGPDGDVYYGVLEAHLGAHHLRGWLLHFDRTLAIAKTPGAFGWDDTASIVPRAAVPSYAGSSRYLLLSKYNDYVEGGGDGVNRVAVLDPNATMTDPIAGIPVMAEVMTATGPTPDAEFVAAGHPNAVREWCINTAAIDPRGRAAFVNNEDGVLYRWDLATGALSQSIPLTAGVGEAYTPTVVGPDGVVYAINDATLFAVAAAP